MFQLFFCPTSWQSKCVAEPLISLEDKDRSNVRGKRPLSADAETRLFLGDEGFASRLAVRFPHMHHDIRCIRQRFAAIKHGVFQCSLLHASRKRHKIMWIMPGVLDWLINMALHVTNVNSSRCTRSLTS